MANRIVKGMILQQPWARLVAEGVFPVLVRAIPTNVRGRVAIIAKGIDMLALVDERVPLRQDFPEPAAIGSIEIMDCLKVPGNRILHELMRRYGKTFSDFYPPHYLPRRSPAYFWFLGNPRLYARARSLKSSRNRVWMRFQRL